MGERNDLIGNPPDSPLPLDAIQLSIYQRLTRVAPAAAEMFLDASSLASNMKVLRSRQHLVAHLVREIDSTLTGLLDPGDASRNDNGSHDGEATKRNRIVELLGLEDDEPWLDAVKDRSDRQRPHAWAHRRGVDRLRDDDERFSDFWNVHLTIFDALLDLFDRKSALIQRQIELLTEVPPSKAAARTLSERVPRDFVSLNQLFSRCTQPEWLVHLRSAGFFDSPPYTVVDPDSGGYIHYGWPAGSYLVQMAGVEQVQAEVTEILRKLPKSDNPRTYQTVVEAALQLPPRLAAQLVPQVLTGLRMQERLPLATEVSKLAAHLASQGELDAAYGLAAVLLEVHREDGAFGPSAVSSHRSWAFAESCKTLAPALIPADPLRACGFASSCLEAALESEAIEGHPDWDRSEYWRPALTDEDEREDDIRNALVDFTLAAFSGAVQMSALAIGDAVSLLMDRPYLIFRRMALHLLTMHPELEVELTERYAFIEEPDEDDRTLHEVARLRSVAFPLVTPTSRERFLSDVERGPETSDWAARFTAHKEQPPTEEDEAEYIRWWRLRLLFPVREHLDSTWQQRYEEMESLQKAKPAWDDYAVYRSRNFWGDPAPLDEAKVAQMSVPELVAYLQKWEPTGDSFTGPTIRGMANQLATVVEKEPERFASDADQFLDLRQEYVNALIRGLEQAVRANTQFEWRPVIQFLVRIAVEERYEFTGAGRSEGNETLAATAALLDAGLLIDKNHIPDDLHEQVWQALQPALSDPNPTPDHEQEYGGTNMDPFMLSINSVRGKATHTLISLLVAKARASGVFDQPVDTRDGVTRWPELAAGLESLLDTESEKSLAVRSAIGGRLDVIGLIDGAWLQQHLSALFPPSDEPRRQVVFDTYLLWGTIRKPVVPLLKDEYLYRASHLSDEPAVTWPDRKEPRDALARHIVALYLHEEIELDDPLVQKVYEEQNQPFWEAATGRAVLALQRNSDLTEEIEPSYVARAQRLWEWRMESAESARMSPGGSHYNEELTNFGHWVTCGAFPEDWWLEHLLRALDITHWVEPDGLVLKKVAEVSSRHPLESAAIATELLLNDRHAFLASGYREAFKAIVEAAIGSSLPVAKRKGRDLANRLVARGYSEYRPFATEAP